MQERQGRIASINLSAGGIPKAPVAGVRVLSTHLEGDGRAHPKHAKSWRAVSLLDADQLDRFRRAGHPVGPGTMGENLTVEGIESQSLLPGERLEFAGGVVLVVSEPRLPCQVLDAIDERLKDESWGHCGTMLRVERPGELHAGETFQVVPNPMGGDCPVWPHTLAILAGGQGRRIGQYKAGLRLADGRSLLEHVVENLRPLAERIVVLGAGTTDSAHRRLGLEWIPDRRPGCGPLAGLDALMNAVPDDRYLVVACDQPRLDLSCLRLLVERDAEIRERAVDAGTGTRGVFFRSDAGEYLDPLPGLFPADWRESVERHLAENRLALHKMVRSLEPAWRTIPVALSDRLAGINTPEDLDVYNGEIRMRS